MKIRLSDHFTLGRLLRFTLPSIAMMVCASVYGMVDGIFVSNFAGKTAFAAVNLIMPYLMAFGTLGFMLGTGGTALISMSMGAGDMKRANSLFSQFSWICVFGGLVLTVISIFFMRPAAIALGAQGQMLSDCMTYGVIVQLALTGYILQFAFQSFCVTAEKPQLSLIMTVGAGMCNLVLDALFVAVFRWGIVGAAAATATAQLLGGAIPFLYFLRPNPTPLRITAFRLDLRALGRACVNGSSELMSNLSMSLVNILYNLQLMHYAGENGVAAYGVMMYVNFLFISVFLGFSVGTAPVIGYHNGAQNRKELKNVTRLSLGIIGMVSLMMTGAAEFLANVLSGIFVSYDSQLREMTCLGFRIYSLSFLLCGFNIFGSALFTALNNGLISAVISFLRTLVCQSAAVLILPVFFDLNGIWWSIVAAELAALALTGFCFVKNRRRYGYI